MIGVIVIRARAEELRIDERVARQLAGPRVLEEVFDVRQVGELAVCGGRPRHVVEVVLVRDVGVVEQAPDALEPDDGHVGLVALRRRAVEIEPVRPRRPHDRREPAIADRERVAELVRGRKLGAVVIAHRVALVRSGMRHHEPVVLAVVPLGVTGVPRVVDVLGDELVESEGRDARAIRRGVALVAREAVDLPTLVDEARAEVVVERAILHAKDDDRVDPGEELAVRDAVALAVVAIVPPVVLAV